jgi:PAS domain S-box-containing protein
MTANGDSGRLISAIVENLPHMIFVKDARNLRFVLLNRAGEALLGVPREQMVGKSDFDLFPREQAEFFVAMDREVLRSGRPMQIPAETILSSALGQRVLRTVKVAVAADDGQPGYLLGISEDITEQLVAKEERNKLHRQLDEAQKMGAIGRLAAGIAHDFNNYLMVILANGQQLQQTVGTDPLAEELIEEILQAANRGADLSRKILAFSRRQPLDLLLVDFNAVIENVDWLFRRLLGHDVTLRLNLDRDAGVVKAATGQLERVITNLVLNARDAMPNGGTVTIATTSVTLNASDVRDRPGTLPGPHVLLTVSDTGDGLREEARSGLFEAGFTTKAAGKGAGLGLATVFDIVRQSGGFVAVNSEPGLGTEFRVYLPRAVP